MSITLEIDRPTANELDALAHLWITGMARGMAGRDEACFQYPAEEQVEDIETESRDGFIPWTQGGYTVTLAAALSHHWGTGMAPAPVQPLIDSGQQIIADEWTRRYPDRPALGDCFEGPFREEAEEWESESWQNDTDCYFWKARVMFEAADSHNNDTGEDRVYLDAYLNTDLNYGRDHIAWAGGDQTSGSWKRTFTIAEFEALQDDGIEALIREALDALP